MKNGITNVIYRYFPEQPILVKNEKWESELFPVEQFNFYKLSFSSKSPSKNYWAIIFFDENRNQLLADNYSSFEPSTNWEKNVFYFRGKCNAKFGKLIFHPIKKEGEFYIDKILIQKAKPDEVLKWIETTYKKIPPVEKFEIKKDKIPETLEKLKKGKNLRIVMLGDSIVNDMGNSFFDILLKKVYPKAKIEVITSVRGGTGCWYYEKENRVKEFVIDYNPDLLIIGGISNQDNVDSIRNVIKQVREVINPEIILMSKAVGKEGDPRTNPEWTFEIVENSYRDKLKKLAEEENVEFFDIEKHWGNYIKNSNKPYDFFLRDPVHANEYGRIVLAYLLFYFFSPYKEIPSKQTSENNKFFTIKTINGKWWFVSPEGNLFISKGINHINFKGDFCPSLGYSPYYLAVSRKYTTESQWAEKTIGRMKNWGFNTIGAWSSPSLFSFLPYTLILNMGSKAGGDWQKGTFPDVFDKKFEEIVDKIAKEECLPRKNDHLLIGYFIDNELRWGPDWRSPNHILDDYFSLSGNSQGKYEIIKFFKSKYETPENFKKIWGIDIKEWEELVNFKEFPSSLNEEIEKKRLNDRMEFLYIVALRYFKITVNSIKKYDPNHLILGVRFAGYVMEPVIKAMKDFVDVVSFNWYGFEIPVEILNKIYTLTGKPVIITEFSFKALDSGLPNSKGAGKPVQTQKERAEYFEKYVTELMKLPYIIGYHWFQWSDQPKEGRFDGENNNYGIVKENDKEWEILVEKMKEINEKVEKIHLLSKE